MIDVSKPNQLKLNEAKLIQSVKKYLDQAQVNKVKDIFSTIIELYRRDQKTYFNKIADALQVATVLAKLQMGTETICASLLYYSVRTSLIPTQQIKHSFQNYQYLFVIVNGLNKADLTKKHYNKSARSLKHSRNFRYLFLAICPDIRVVIIEIVRQWIKLNRAVDHHLKSAAKTARESIWVFAPLAGRLGIEALKWRLQDLAFKQLDPQRYHDIYHWLDKNQVPRRKYINGLIKNAKQALKPLNLSTLIIYGRPKHIYSIYHKLTVRHKTFQEIYDFLAIRIIVNTVSECYAVLSTLMTKAHWKPMPHRFKDYIMNPKSNSYQSLHTTVFDQHDRALEIQIRTKAMHQIDEYGIAAHWAYKRGIKGKVSPNNDNRQLNSFKMMITNRKQFHPNYNLKSDLFRKHVFVFTPNNDIISLPKGAIPLDFAYRIHTEVGNHMIGAKVNHKIVSKDYQLNNGDSVSILTSPNAPGPSRDWLSLVKSKNAKRKIKHYIRRKNRHYYIMNGKQKLWHRINVLNNPKINTQVLDKVARKRRYTNFNDFLASIGNGITNVDGVIRSLKQMLKANRPLPTTDIPATPQSHTKSSDSRGSVIVAHSDNFLFKISHCCYPVPGDSIIGYITRHQGIAVHRTSCPKLKKKLQKVPQQIIRTRWANNHGNGQEYLSSLQIKSYDYNGLVRNVLNVAQQEAKQVTSIASKYHTNNNGDIIMLQVKIADVKELRKLIAGLRAVKNVYQVNRIYN